MNITAVIDNTIRLLDISHFDRPAGSGVDGWDAGDITVWLRNTDMTDVTANIDNDCTTPECRYYRFPLPQDATQAICLVEDLTDEQLDTVRLRRGHHGNVELVSPVVVATPVDFGHVIVGPHEGEQVVWTWYPGRVTPYVNTQRATVKRG
jgi:hypothetical protein